MTATIDRRADYVSAVAVELADLPAEERAELIEELDDHVAALLEDRPDVDLVSELGTPRAYAAELRTAAGLTAGGPARTSPRDLARALADRAVHAAPWLPSFLRLLRPGWWVLRGGVIAAVVLAFLGIDATSAVAVVFLLAGVVGSLWLGQRPRTTTGLRRTVTGVNVVAALSLVWLVVAVPFAGASGTYYETQYVPNCPSELSNLFAYDATGKPLDDVRLYDQYGAPFDLSTLQCQSGEFAPGPNGVNAYPWPSWTVGGVAEPTGPPSSLAPLPGATAPAASATPSAGATPSAAVTPSAGPAATS